MNVDLEGKMLSNLPILIDNVGYIYSLTLKEIAQIGITRYNQILSFMCFNIEDIIKNTTDDDIDYTTFDIILGNCLKDKEFAEIILLGLNLFFREDVNLSPNIGGFIVGDIKEEQKRMITRDNYEEIKEIIKIKNGINKNKTKDDYNPANAKAKEILLKLKKSKEKIEKAKGSDTTDLTLWDLVSILASNSNNLNIINIWELDMYQFNNQFARMQIFENYDVNVRSLLAGADSKNVDLKHWLCKI